MGEELGVNHTTLNRWETGVIRPPGRWLDLALRALDCAEGERTA